MNSFNAENKYYKNEAAGELQLSEKITSVLFNVVAGIFISFILLTLIPAKGHARTYNTLTNIDTDVTNSGWDTFDEVVSTQTVTTDWGVSASTNLYVTWDSEKIYIGLHAGLESKNEILIYFDMDYQATDSTGAASLDELTDNTGSIDNTASYCDVDWTDTDFKPDFCIGWSADVDDNVEGVRGWVGSGENTEFSGTSFSDFGWYTPYSISNDGANTGDFEVVLCSTMVWTTAPADAKIALLVVIANDGSLSNQFLPPGTSGSDLTPYVVQVTNSASELFNKWNPAKNLPGRNSVTISEVFYNDSETTDIDDWVELYNAANYPVNLENWILKAWDEARTSTYTMKLPDVNISSGSWITAHPKSGTDRTNYWGIKQIFKGSDEDWFGSGAGTCELYDSSYTITGKSIIDFFTWDCDGTVPSIDVDTNAVTANIWVEDDFYDGTGTSNRSIERIDNSSETYKNVAPLSCFSEEDLSGASEAVDNNGDDGPTASKILGVVTTESDFTTNTQEVIEGATVYFKIDMDGAQDNASYKQAVICKATSTSDQTGIFVTAREDGISSNDYQGLIKLTLTSPSTSAMDALWAPLKDTVTVRTIVDDVYYDTVTVVAGPNTEPDAPSKLAQYSEDWTVLDWGDWTNYNVIRASFTLSDPDTDEQMQFNIQFSTYSDFSFYYINSTAPATATLDEGATNFLTTRAVDLLPEGTWYWRVMATDDDGLSSAYASSDTANGYHLRIDVSTPNNVGCSKPLNNSFDLETSTSLTALTATDSLSGVSDYQFNASTSSSFDGGDDIDSGWQTGVTYSPSLEGNTTYYWRVRVKDVVGNISEWCGDADTAGWWKFKTINSTPDAPTKLGQYLEDWTELEWSTWTKYQHIRATFTLTDPDRDDKLKFNIKFSTHSDFSYCYVNSTQPSSATLEEGATNYITALLPEGTWYWKVKAVDAGGLSGLYASSDTANGYHLRIDTHTPTNVGCSSPSDDEECIAVKTSLDALTASDSLSGVYQYQFDISTATTFDKPGDQTSAWQSGNSWTPGTQLKNDTTYYWRVRVKDKAENISEWCGNADESGYHKFITELRGIDGDSSDWTGSPTTIDNTSQISDIEWIWRDKSWEEREDSSNDDDVDLREVRICADSNAVYFLVEFADITDTQYPYVAVGIDTDTADSGMDWVADESDVTMGDEYGRAEDKYHNPEQNIIVHYTDADSLVQIEKATGAFTNNWYAPDTYGGGVCNFSDTNDVAEFKIARADIGLDGDKSARFTVSLYDNYGDWANDANTTTGYDTCDALDAMSIVRISTEDNTYNDTDDDMSAWDEDISDADIDFWTELSFISTGIAGNKEPEAPTTADSPADDSAIYDLTPTLSWSGATDADGETDITSYKLIIDTTSTADAPYTYKVNVATSTEFTIPSNLTPDVTYYWYVYTRDKSGDCSPKSTTWEFYVHGRTIDGDISDWGTETAFKINSSTFNASKNEFIWRDKLGNERTDSSNPDCNFDIDEVRVTANDTYIYFLFKSSDITNIDYPHFALSIDTDTDLTDDSLDWIDDESDGADSMKLGTDYNSKIRAERNIIVCSSESANTHIFLYADDGTSWYDPSSGDWEAYASDTNEVFEVKINRSDIVLEGEKKFRFSLESPENFAGDPETLDTTVDYDPDALDAMTIVRLSTGSGAGQYYNDTANDMSAWDEEISDSDIDFWSQIKVSEDGIISNNYPDKPINPDPADNGKYSSDVKPTLSWDAATDPDTGDFITSYLIEFATHSDLGGDLSQTDEYGYRINIASSSSPSWTIPEDLKNDLTYYWRVFSRDACGTLSPGPDIWAVKVDSVPPASVTNLSALTGTSPGEIDLTWTAPGDNNSIDALDTGSKFRLEYASWTTVVWSTDTSVGDGYYDDIETTVSPGVSSSKTIDSLLEGVTYYFRIWTADEIPNWSALSNAATTYACVNPVPSAEAQMVYYSSSTVAADQQFPSFRNWTGTEWSDEFSAEGVTSTASGWYVLKKAPSRDEWILGIEDADGHLNVQIYDNTTKTWGNIKELSTYGSYEDRRWFDIAYGQSSSSAVIVFKNPDVTDEVQCVTWDGSVYSSVYTLTLSTHGAGTINWLRLEAKPSSDEMILGIQDDSSDISFHVMDGTSVVSDSGIVAEWATEGTGVRCFDIAWEQTTGKGMALWAGADADNYYRTWDGSIWSSSATVDMGALDISVSNGYWIRLAACPNSKNILMGTVESSTLDLDAVLWDGTSWGSDVELNADLPDYDGQYYDLAWESSSEDGIATYTVNTETAAYRTYSAGSWGSELQASPIADGAYVRWMRLSPDDDSDEIMLVHSDTHSAVNVQKWDGSAWGSITEAEDNSLLNYQCFDVAYPLKLTVPDTTAPAAISDLTAIAGSDDEEIDLRWTAPGDDGMSGDISEGEIKILASTYNITSANFDSITENPYYTYLRGGATSYSTQGTEHTYTMTGLYAGTTYYFAIKVRDDVENWSSWSDTASSSDTVAAQDLEPKIILDLQATAEYSKITLDWSEPSGEPDLDFYKFYRDSTTATLWDDAYTFNVDIGNDSYQDSGLENGVTYYYRSETFDYGSVGDDLYSIALSSAYSNVVSTCPTATPSEIIIVYSSGTLNYPWFREIASGTTYWGTQQSGIPHMNSEIQHISVKENSIEDEEILMAGINAETDDYEIWVTTRIDDSWANSAIQIADALSTGGPGMDDCRGFDLTYEDQSGLGLVAYTKETDDTLYYRTWDGSSFSAEASTAGLPTGDLLTPYWIKMARRPGYDDIALIYLASDGTDNEIGTLIWDGANNKFSEQLLLENSASSFSKESLDVSAMNESRDFMFVWGSGTVLGVTNLESRRWDGDFLSEVSVGTGGDALDDVPEFLSLKSNTTDQLMLGITDAGAAVSAIRYDGSNWDNSIHSFDAAARDIDNKYVDIEWEDDGDGNYSILVFGDGADTDWAYWDGSGWTESGGLYGDESNRVELTKQPDGNIWLCNYLNTDAVYKMRRWDSSGDVWNSSTTIFNVVDGYTGYYQKFCFSPKTESTSPPPDETAPAAITTIAASTYTLTGQIKLEWESPGDDDWNNALDPDSQYKIQHSTYNLTWDKDNAQITISTSGTSPHTVVSKITTLSKETTYYFRIWTADEVPNWSDISSGATCWARIAPAAITTLSSLAEDDGDVSLSWTAPGDDGTTGSIADGQWKIRYSTIATVDWATASAEWTDIDDKYELLIDTSCDPLSKHTNTITPLHGGVTYYFRIWTRDEDTKVNAPGNWSDISNGSTDTVTEVISVSLSTDTYDFGELEVNLSTVSLSTITITNDGNVTEKYSMLIASITKLDGSHSNWKSTDTTVGEDRFILHEIFHNVQTSTDNYQLNDAVIDTSKTSSDTIFTDDDEPPEYQEGIDVLKGDDRKLWFRLDTPTGVTQSASHKITVRIDAAKQ